MSIFAALCESRSAADRAGFSTPRVAADASAGILRKYSFVSVPIRSITFWLNAFIPRDIAGATTVLREGEYKGLTAFSVAPCYLTDQRNFSNEMRAPSRMHSIAKVDLDDLKPVLTQWHRCDDLVECDPVSGEVLRQRQGSTEEGNVLAGAVP